MQEKISLEEIIIKVGAEVTETTLEEAAQAYKELSSEDDGEAVSFFKSVIREGIRQAIALAAESARCKHIDGRYVDESPQYATISVDKQSILDVINLVV